MQTHCFRKLPQEMCFHTLRQKRRKLLLRNVLNTCKEAAAVLFSPCSDTTVGFFTKMKPP